MSVAEHAPRVETLLKKYPEVFKGGLKAEAKPTFMKARPVPFAQKEPIERELERLEEAGVIVKVSYSPWTSPVVPVPKANGQLRLCGDYKVALNPVSRG